MRQFTTTATRRWQYNHRQALSIAGPELLKTDKKAHMNRSKGTPTSLQPLPLALRVIKPVLNVELLDALVRAKSKRLDEGVTGVLDLGEQTVIQNEASLM